MSNDNKSLKKIFEKIDINLINRDFKDSPQLPENLNIKDIVLFSKVWQKVARDIASSFINLNEYVIDYLKKRFGNLKPKRRSNAVKQYLIREFLLDEYKINEIIESLWAG